MISVRPFAGIRLGGIGNPDIVGFQRRRRVAALFLYHDNVVGGLRRVNLSQIGFKPNLIVVCSDSQGGDAIQELVYRGELNRI